MAAVVPNEGERACLDILLDSSWNARLGLFKNDMTPNADSEYADFNQANNQSTVWFNLHGGAACVTSGSGRAKKSFTNITFERTSVLASETIYGWFIVIEHPADNELVWMAKRFTTPVVIANIGDKVSFDLDLFATEVAA